MFAIFPILFLFAYNIEEITSTDLFLPILATITLALIVSLSLRLTTNNYNKIAIVTSYFLVLFFTYGRIWELILPLGIGKLYTVTISLGLLWAVLFLTGALLIIKSSSNFLTFTKFLNIVAITLVTISLINIGFYGIKTPLEINNEGSTNLNLGNPERLPDIYYIILDEYARQDTIKEAAGYDNSGFIDNLISKGFYVASKSRCNYWSTRLSMSSSLNMEYVNYLSDMPLIEQKKQITTMLANNKVAQFLKSKGYRYVYVFGGFEWRDMEKYTDSHFRYKNIFGIKVSNFLTTLVRTTALLPIAAFLGYDARNVRLYAFDKLADIPDIKEPTFVYSHIMCPHGPFVFDRYGNPPKEGEGTYLDQFIFVNKKVEILVDEILSTSETEPIIILQGDHGITWGTSQQRAEILNAYYLPRENGQLLYDTITPVNSFRVIFNAYFGTNYELLRDESHTDASHTNDSALMPTEGD